MSLLNLSISLLAIVLVHYANSQKYSPTWASLDTRPLPQWYDDSKIGIFLHWGVFSVPSYKGAWFWWSWLGEKNPDYIKFMTKNYKPNFTYADFANQFTAEFYDPVRWADIFKSSGAKYVVLTSKHHEGFTLWPSKYSWNWNAMDVGPNRDLVGDLSKAVRGSGLHFGVYHSLYEWFNPLYLKDKASNWSTHTFVEQKTLRELEELVNNYKPDVIWSDGDWEAPAEYWQSQDFLAWLYNDSPVKDTVVVNDRWGKGTSCKHGGYYNCADRFKPEKLLTHKWENAMTIDRKAWEYRRDAVFADFLTPHELLSTLAQTVSCGGNLLVNVGPTHDGRITPIFEERLRDMGDWLSINGEAIYGSKPWTHQNDTLTKNIWYTKNDKTVYSMVLFWPNNNQLELGSVPFNIVDTIELLGRPGTLEISAGTGGQTVVKFPVLNPESKVRWVYVLKIKTK